MSISATSFSTAGLGIGATQRPRDKAPLFQPGVGPSGGDKDPVGKPGLAPMQKDFTAALQAMLMQAQAGQGGQGG